MRRVPERHLQVGVKLPIEEGRKAEAVQKARAFVQNRFPDEKFSIIISDTIPCSPVPEGATDDTFLVKDEKAPEYFKVIFTEVKVIVGVTEKTAAGNNIENVALDLAMSGLYQTRFKHLNRGAVASVERTEDISSHGALLHSDGNGSEVWLSK